MSKIINTEFNKNYAWQDGYLPQVESIIKRNAYHLLDVRLASKIEDTRQSTDMVMQVKSDVSVAVRIRRHTCAYRDLTLRTKSWGNGKTEIDKLRDGWGSWYVYAWSNVQGILDEWMLINISKLRTSGLLDNVATKLNKDGKTGFASISITKLYESNALTAAHLLRHDRYWHHIIDMEAGRVWEPSAYSILNPAA